MRSAQRVIFGGFLPRYEACPIPRIALRPVPYKQRAENHQN